MKKELDEYEIKIPVYVTEQLSKKDEDLFGYTYQNLLTHVKRKIDSFNESSATIVTNKRNKPRKKEIHSILYKEANIGEAPVLLIQMDAFTTNNYDLYIEREKRVPIDREDKIGSGNHWMLMYPRIVGLNPNEYICFWYIFVYADPTKDFEDVTNSAKLFIKKVMGIRLRNVKSAEMMKELSQSPSVQELQVRYISLTNDENDIDIKFQAYKTRGLLKQEKEDCFENMPFATVVELINETNYLQRFQQKIIKVFNGKKEYRIEKKNIDESGKLLEDYIEESFNMSSIVTEAELDETILYSEDFMLSKFKPVVENYISSYAD